MPIGEGLRNLSETEARIERKKRRQARKKKAKALGSMVKNLFRKRRVA